MGMNYVAPKGREGGKERVVEDWIIAEHGGTTPTGFKLLLHSFC